MRSFDQWMTEYQRSHTHPTNKIIHKIFVPLIVFSVIGLLWSIPIPNAWSAYPFLNWATLFILGSLIFYLLLDLKMFIGMILVSFFFIFLCSKLQQLGGLLQLSVVIFVVSWIVQIWGHKIEGKKPSFMKDLAFLLIGPLWVLKAIYEKVGIKV
jgi:uncharacterized membrane protein YGL010W